MNFKRKLLIPFGCLSLSLMFSGCLTGNLFRSPRPMENPAFEPNDNSFSVPDGHSSNPNRQDSSTFKPNETLKLPVTPRDEENSPNPNSQKTDPKQKGNEKNQDGPRIVPQGVEVPVNLQLTVTAAKKRQVGSQVTFRLRLRNSGNRMAENVQVETIFDDSFVFPGHPEKKITRTFEKVAAGQSEEFELTLTSDTVGKHCCQFRVFYENREKEWKQVCVEFIPRKLQTILIGPPKRMEGTRVEYTLKVSNVSNEVLNDTKMSLRFPDTLVPKEASRGAKQHSDFIDWELGSLKPGEGVQMQVEFECQKASSSVCVSLAANASDLPETVMESCLEIVKPNGEPVLHLSDSNDPIKLGDETEYIVTVENPTQKPMKLLQIKTFVPEQFRILSTSSRLGDKKLDWKADIEGSTVTFDAIGELKPLEKQQFKVRVKALRAGDAQFRATISSPKNPNPNDFFEVTTVNAS